MCIKRHHYNGVILSAMVSQIAGVSIVCSIVCSGAHQSKQQSSTSLAFVWEIHQWPVVSHHKGSVTRKMFPFNLFVSLQSNFWCIHFFSPTPALSTLCRELRCCAGEEHGRPQKVKGSSGRASTWMGGPIEHRVPNHYTCQAVRPGFRRPHGSPSFYGWNIKSRSLLPSALC